MESENQKSLPEILRELRARQAANSELSLELSTGEQIHCRVVEQDLPFTLLVEDIKSLKQRVIGIGQINKVL